MPSGTLHLKKNFFLLSTFLLFLKDDESEREDTPVAESRGLRSQNGDAIVNLDTVRRPNGKQRLASSVGCKKKPMVSIPVDGLGEPLLKPCWVVLERCDETRRTSRPAKEASEIQLRQQNDEKSSDDWELALSPEPTGVDIVNYLFISLVYVTIMMCHLNFLRMMSPQDRQASQRRRTNLGSTNRLSHQVPTMIRMFSTWICLRTRNCLMNNVAYRRRRVGKQLIAVSVPLIKSNSCQKLKYGKIASL